MLRGALSKKTELIEFFKFLDANTEPKYLGKPYFDPKSPDYGEKTQYKGYRPVNYGAYRVAMNKFAYNGKPVSMPTIFNRIKLFKDGMTGSNKPTQAGAKPVAYEKWELTPTHKLIFETIGADKNSIKNQIRLGKDKVKITYNKRGKYDRACYLAFQIMGVDPLEASEADWLKVWGKEPKTPNSCDPRVRDSLTGLVHYGHTTGIRWAMQNSKDPTVSALITKKDARFNTKEGIKRDKGRKKGDYFTEEQCLMLPQAINKVDTLFLCYFGDLFGGRFGALNELTPLRIKFSAHKIEVFESKVQHLVEKSIFEPETTFIRQYIMDAGIKENEPLFGRDNGAYNTELKATKEWFAQTPFPLDEWSSAPTTHTAFKHTCVTQMSLHGVRMDTISDYIGTDPNTLKQFYRGGSEENVQEEIGGIEKKKQAATWRAFIVKLTQAYAKRYEELTGRRVNLPHVALKGGDAA